MVEFTFMVSIFRLQGIFSSGGGTKGSDRGSSNGSNATALNGSEPGPVPDATPSGSKVDSNAKG